jgi:hypothetical protein
MAFGHKSATVTYEMWRKGRLWNVSVLQSVSYTFQGLLNSLVVERQGSTLLTGNGLQKVQ